MTGPAPRSGRLLELLRRALATPELSAGDDLFSVGVTSLQIVAIRERILHEFGVCIELEDVFTHPTAAQLEEFVGRQRGAEPAAPLLAPVGGPGRYPASAAQARMYVMAQLNPGSIGYNMPEAVRLDGPVTTETIVAIVERLHRRHEGLHTRFEVNGTRIEQIVDPGIAPEITVRPGGRGDVDDAMGDLVAPFDLARGPLYRVAVLEASATEHYLLLDMHHIISDGWSEVAYLAELLDSLEGAPLPPLPIQYKDHAAWDAARTTDIDPASAAADICRIAELGPLPTLTLPTDRPRPAAQSFVGARLTREIDAHLLAELEEFGGRVTATVHIVLMAAFAAVLHRWSGQDDLVIGAPSAGRSRPELDRVIGMFVNMTANRVAVGPDATLRDVLEATRAACLTSLRHADVQFDQLVDALHLRRDTARNPLFDHVFAFQNLPLPSTRRQGVELSLIDFDYPLSRFDLFCSVVPLDRTLRVHLEYSTALFDPGTAEAFLADFLSAAHTLTSAPDTPLHALPVARTRATVAAALPTPTFSF